jgi:hypothetical protein
MEVTQGGGGSSDKVKVKPKTGSVFFEYQSAEIDATSQASAVV